MVWIANIKPHCRSHRSIHDVIVNKIPYIS